MQLLASETAAPLPDSTRLLAALQQPPPVTTAFFERRRSPLLTEPLLFDGELQRPQAGVLIKQVQSPYRERTRIDSERVLVERDDAKPRSFSLRRAPELHALTAGIDAVLGGDIDRLQQHFSLTMQGDDDAWQLQLTPIDRRLARRVESMRFIGSADVLLCMDLLLAGGENSRTWLGPLAARAAAAADESGRDALCGSAD